MLQSSAQLVSPFIAQIALSLGFRPTNPWKPFNVWYGIYRMLEAVLVAVSGVFLLQGLARSHRNYVVFVLSTRCSVREIIVRLYVCGMYLL